MLNRDGLQIRHNRSTLYFANDLSDYHVTDEEIIALTSKLEKIV